MKKLSTLVGVVALAALGSIGVASTSQAAPQEYPACEYGDPTLPGWNITNKPCTITYAVDACGSTDQPYTRTLLYMKNGAVREVTTDTSAPKNCN